MRTTSTLSLHSDPPPPFPSDDPTSSSSSSHPIVYDVKSDLTQFSSPFPFPILTQLAQLFAQVDTLGLGTLAYHQLTYCIDVCLRHLQSIYVTHPIPSQTEMDQLLFSHMPDFMHLREEQRITFEQVHKILCTCVVLPSSTSPPRSPISFRQNVPSIPPLSPTSHVSVPIPSPRPSHSTSPVPTSLHSKRSPSSDFTTLKRPRFIPFILGIHVILMLSMLIWQRHWAWTHLNPMLGPTPQTLITWGATYVPCMRPNEMVSLKLSELETMCSWSAFRTSKHN
ncbi:hypothetical protein HMI55_006360 [Coelomomyces lativittatus]|nr:hypothetical protein HMI55_006360 [Coelomomyces lativittatus]